jgi:hypothetical protein
MNSAFSGLKSRAELFFEEVLGKKKRAFGFLEKLVQPEAQTDENEWRDFKEAEKLTAPLPADKKAVRDKHDENLKEIWSKSLGAFANSGGGVLIWGIKAPNRIAEELSLAHDAQKLAERLIQWAADALDPPLRGIRVEPITKASSTKEGFVVCLVPESPLKPHRSRWSGNEFYLRLQDGCKPLPMSLLRSLFHPNLAPRLAIHYMVQVSATNMDRVSVCVSVSIENASSSTAHKVVVQAIPQSVLNSTFEIFPERGCGWSSVPNSDRQFVGTEPLHPGQTIKFGRMQGHWAGNTLPSESSVRVATRIYARNMQPHYTSVEFSSDEIRKAFETNKSIQKTGTVE